MIIYYIIKTKNTCDSCVRFKVKDLEILNLYLLYIVFRNI